MTEVKTLISGGKRKVGQSNLQTVDFDTFLAETEATSVAMVTSLTGTRYIHLKNSDEYWSVKVSKKVDLTGIAEEDVIPYLIENCKIYIGDEDRDGNKLDNTWFTFAPAGNTGEPTTVISVVELRKRLGGAKGMAAKIA